MKKVLVGMDFSQGAMNAFDYAIDLSIKHASEICLLWIEKAGNEPNVVRAKNEIRHDAKLELEKLIEQKLLEYPNLTIKFKQRKGKVYKEFANIAESGNFDLAVIGTHGIDRIEEFRVDSNCSNIISYCPCPVISVRTDFNKGGVLNKLVLPIDSSRQTTEKVAMAAEIALEYNAEIEILGIYESNLASLNRKTDQYVVETERYLTEKGVSHQFFVCKSNNPSQSIVKFAEENEVDLMVIMSDQNKATSDIIMGKQTQHLINRSAIPILSVKPYKLEKE